MKIIYKKQTENIENKIQHRIIYNDAMKDE